MSKSRFFRIACLAVLAASLGCLATQAIAPRAGAAEPQPNVQALAKVMAVQDRNTPRLMSIKGVVGTATGLDAAGRPVVKVFLAQPGVRGIPVRLDGEAVEAEVTGEFSALGKPAKPPAINRTARFPTPVPIGVSTGNEYDASAGTIGCRLVDLLTGTRYALSNVHVFDPWHYGAEPNAVTFGERIVQPGRIDDPLDNLSGLATPENIVGTVVGCVPIDFSGGNNYVDAAIAIVPTLDGFDGSGGVCRELGNSTPTDGYGVPSNSTVLASIGLSVQKYGRTTGLTKGTVTAIHATVNVGYGTSGTARFVEQIIVENRTAFLKAGDSGSLLVTQDGNKPTGLLFAGNSTGKMAIANHIDVVLGLFTGVSIDGQ